MHEYCFIRYYCGKSRQSFKKEDNFSIQRREGGGALSSISHLSTQIKYFLYIY